MVSRPFLYLAYKGDIYTGDIQRLMDYYGDERGQAMQVGAVLLFGILIVAFSLHQAYIIPNQNKKIEFNHFTETQDEMETARNAVISAGQDGNLVATEVQLGTRYPPRLMAAQPQQAYGQLRVDRVSSESYQLDNAGISFSDLCGRDSVPKKTATYEPSYTYLNSVGNVTYENTVIYTTGRTGGHSFQTEQQLIDGTTVHVYPLVGDFNQGGSGMASVTLRGNKTGSKSVSGPFSLIVPTRLSASEWEELLGGEVKSVEPAGGQAVNITLYDSNYDIKCSPVGVGEDPNNDPKYVSDVGSGTESGAFSIGWEDPSSETGTESPCDTTDCYWNVSADDDNTLSLTAATTPAIENMGVEFGVDDTSVGTISSPDGVTDTNGQATMELRAQKNGTVGVYVASGGTSDIVNITLTDVKTTDVGTVPSGSYAYADEDNDLEYDPGETTYSESELYSFSKDVNLVIPSDVGSGSISNGKISINANKITSRVDVTSTNDNVKFDANSEGGIDINGTTINSAKSAKLVQGKQIAVKDVQINAEKKAVLSGTDITGVNSDITTNTDNVKLDGNGEGPIDLPRATIDSGKSVKLVQAKSTTVDDGTFTAEKKVVMSGTEISATNAAITTTNSDNVALTASGGGIQASGIQIDSDKNIKLNANGDIYIDDSGSQEAKITAVEDATASLNQGSRTLYLDGVEISDTDNKLDYSPNGVTVDGYPESGGVT